MTTTPCSSCPACLLQNQLQNHQFDSEFDSVRLAPRGLVPQSTRGARPNSEGRSRRRFAGCALVRQTPL
ncbi:hypothetical protein FHX57_005609 [Paraburkholderia tropica]|uniref:hypothetical protein n=1 Tax=Paraburkholderia tropica TaxID=92647 RepID=UPI000F54BD30|nr:MULTISPECIES: hypothetical protein [Paraburkholderia]MBB3003235.1 hypothetical protein [Paraburkholderia tropica]RQM49637.1 hypothetical protein EHZ19_04355 [Paraburkholderia bannensis]RQN36706.1 hypothetical protein EHZ25_22345 [Paraburkholderia tropica]